MRLVTRRRLPWENESDGVCMTIATFGVLAFFLASAAAEAGQSGPVPTCREWRQCRELALEAAGRHEYEAFHDLAWRTMQTGNPKDPDLMYLLARAQSLSGRPHDALVMLQRLVAMGVATDAATNDDFKRTRDLDGWAQLETQMEQLRRPAAAAATPAPAVIEGRSAPAPATPAPPVPPAAPGPGSSTATQRAGRAASPPTPAASGAPAAIAPPPAAPAPAATAPVATAPRLPTNVPAAVAEALRFRTAPFSVAGVAYDAVSHRFLVGDRLGRKLIVIGEGADHSSDLVHGDSAGFRDISAIEIDARRGDLWVATAGADGAGGSLHRLQLVSGRPLKAFPVNTSSETVALVDLAVTPNGTVLVLEAAAPQLLALRPGATALETAVRFDTGKPVSIAATDRDGLAYAASADSIERIDLSSRTVKPVALPKNVALGRFERIRWYKNNLVALSVDSDGSRHIVRLELNAAGTAVSRTAVLDTTVPSDVPAFVTVSGDDLIYIEPSSTAASETELVAYRVRLR
jgi:hypothetical protein